MSTCVWCQSDGVGELMSIRPTVLLPQCEMATVCPSGDVVIIFGSGPVSISLTMASVFVSMTATADGSWALMSNVRR